MDEFMVKTNSRSELLDISAELQRLAAQHPQAVSCVVFVPHTTAGVTINENADPDVKSDILWALGRIVPEAGHFSHREGNSDAHVKASLLGSSVWLPLREGRLDLGVWQTVYLAEFDGPRARQVKVVFQG